MNLYPYFMHLLSNLLWGCEHSAVELCELCENWRQDRQYCELCENWRQDRQYFYLRKLNCMCTCTNILHSVPSHTCCCFTTIPHLVKRWLHFVPVWAGYYYCMFQKHHVTCTVIFPQK